MRGSRAFNTLAGWVSQVAKTFNEYWPVSPNWQLQWSFTGRHAQKGVSKLIVSKCSILISIRIACIWEGNSFTYIILKIGIKVHLNQLSLAGPVVEGLTSLLLRMGRGISGGKKTGDVPALW
jgi:hypothetical protein